MTPERVIQLLQVEKQYRLKQTGHSQQPINKEVRQALDIAIEAVKKQKPEKPIYGNFDDNGFDEIIPFKAKCPICGNKFEFGTWNAEDNHHCICGQTIDWSTDNG